MKRFTKLLALGLAAALMFGMTAQAAGSVTTGDFGSGAKLVDAPEGVEIADIAKDSVAKAEEGAKKLQGIGNVKVVAGFDLTIPEGKEVTLTIAVNGLTAGRNYFLVHMDDNFANPTKIPVTLGNNATTITFTVKSGSPFVLMEEQPAQNNNNNDTPADEGTSPKTGEAVPAAGMMALVLLAGAALCARKASWNR